MTFAARLVSLILSLICGLLLAAFVSSNTAPALLSLWPLEGVWPVPLYLIALVPFAAGLFLGGALLWMATLPLRISLWRYRRRERGILRPSTH